MGIKVKEVKGRILLSFSDRIELSDKQDLFLTQKACLSAVTLELLTNEYEDVTSGESAAQQSKRDSEKKNEKRCFHEFLHKSLATGKFGS